MYKCQLKKTLKKKVVLITNATNALGIELVKILKAKGAKVYLACKDMPQAIKLCKELSANEQETMVHLIPLDLSSLDSVRACVKSFRSMENSLDLLVNNSRTEPLSFSVNQDGEEMNRQVIYLGHYLLTILLLDLGPRIVNVGSQLISQSCAQQSLKWQSYIHSKVDLVYLGLELSYQHPELEVCMAVPGYLENTTLTEFPCYALRKILASPYFCPSNYTPLMAAQNVLYCCLAETIHPGKVYWEGRVLIPSGPNFPSKRTVWKCCKELWKRSSRQVGGGIEDSCLNILD